MAKTLRILLFLFLSFSICSSCQKANHIEVAIWDAISLDFEGPQVSELDEYNPFLNYKLEVTFSNGTDQYVIQGFYAGDGNAAETSSESGNIWRVKFAPNTLGKWDYSVSFHKGEDIVFSKESQGESLLPQGKTGTFTVIPGSFSDTDFRSKGRLTYTPGNNYQQFQGSKEYFIKGGPDSPENLLAYEDFDGTYSYDSTKQFLKSYEPHVKDWHDGDPTWQEGKGKGLIGALNYISDKGMNVVYFLSMNIEGDGRDVWMYRDHKNFTRFDVSKLDQWEIVFDHAQSKGIMLHFVTQETENELLFDDGDVGRQRTLYYRELIARFAHHPAVTWNMGEENGPAGFSPNGQTASQQKAMFKYFKDNDPYQNLVMLHTHSSKADKNHILDPLLADENLDGLSLQINLTGHVHEEIVKWKNLSNESGRNWIIYMDEIGLYWKGVMPDDYDIKHDTIRKEVLWGSLMAGAAGVEWYFGYKYPQADLNCEDWRSRDAMWDQTKYAMDFFQKYIPFWEMETMDQILNSGSAYVFAKPNEIYSIYILEGNNQITLDLSAIDGSMLSVDWYNPRSGGSLISGKGIVASKFTNLGPPPNELNQDWVVILKKI